MTHAATKTWYSQINKYLKRKKERNWTYLYTSEKELSRVITWANMNHKCDWIWLCVLFLLKTENNYKIDRFIGEGNGTPLQYSCLENPMDGGAWWAAVHGVAKSRTRLGDFTFTFHFHALEKEMATDSSVLAWRIPGTVEPGGLLSMGSHRVRHDWSDLAAAAADRFIRASFVAQMVKNLPAMQETRVQSLGW